MKGRGFTARDSDAIEDLHREFGLRVFERQNIDSGFPRRLGERGALEHVDGGGNDLAARFRLTAYARSAIPARERRRVRDLTDSDAVERALAEFDELGRERFLERYHFGKARYFFLVLDGGFYDSKAIAGAAYGYQCPARGPLRFDDFSGGEQTVAAALQMIGFRVIDTRVEPLAPKMPERAPFNPKGIKDARRRTLSSIAVRQGQSRFRRELLRAYGGCCAVTGCNVEAVLEAAHIHPYRGEETNRTDNGLLLRGDLHTLFDLGLIAVGADLRLRVGRRLVSSPYAGLDGTQLSLPCEVGDQPSAEALAWHRGGFGFA